MFNQVTLVGNLGKDPEIRRSNAGDPIANFSIATSERWTDKATGEKKERTEWHNVVIFNEGLAGVAERFLKKGSKVLVVGKMRTREWEKDGVKRYSTEVVLSKFDGTLVMLGDAGQGGGRERSEDDYGTVKSRGAGNGGGNLSHDLNDDIPF